MLHELNTGILYCTFQSWKDTSLRGDFYLEGKIIFFVWLKNADCQGSLVLKKKKLK